MNPLADPRYGNYDWLSGYFKGRKALVIGTGPSIQGVSFAVFRDAGWALIACGRAILIERSIDMWAVRETSQIVIARRDHGIDAYTAKFKTVAAWDSNLMPRDNVAVMPRNGLPLSGDIVATGHMGLEAAIMAGASPIYLLGHDGPVHKNLHAYLDIIEPQRRETKKLENYQTMLPGWDAFRGIADIRNLSKVSLIQTFPRETMEEALA